MEIICVRFFLSVSHVTIIDFLLLSLTKYKISHNFNDSCYLWSKVTFDSLAYAIYTAGFQWEFWQFRFWQSDIQIIWVLLKWLHEKELIFEHR